MRVYFLFFVNAINILALLFHMSFFLANFVIYNNTL